MGLFKKDTVLESKLKRIKEELALVNKDIKSLSDVVKHPDRVISLPPLRSEEMRRPEEPRPARREPGVQVPEVKAVAPPQQASRVQDKPAPEKRQVSRDEKFRDYLSSSFESGAPLRQERRLLRNKIIMLVVFVMMLLFWILYSLLT